MKRLSTLSTIFSIASLGIFFGTLSLPVHAHARWLVPSHTILSGEAAEYATFDISISNDIFNPDHAPGGYLFQKLENPDFEGPPLPPPIKKVMASSQLAVLQPDGKQIEHFPLVNFVRKTVGAAELRNDGTYKVAFKQSPVFLTWYENTDGSPGRLFGKPEQVNAMLPEGAKNIRGTQLLNYLQTWITKNGTSREALKVQGKGLEVRFETHPNELFVGEEFKFSLVFNGEAPEKKINMHFIRNDSRYRNEREAQHVTTDAQGRASITWDKPGLYLLESEYEVKSTEKGLETDTHALYFVFEVFPE